MRLLPPSRQHFTFKTPAASAAAGDYGNYFYQHTQLVYGSHTIAATYQRKSTVLA